MDEISETVEVLKDRVDYIIIRNPARNATNQFFHKNELEKELQGYGAAYLEIPALLSKTRNYLRGHEVMLERGISPAEAVKNPELRMDAIHRMILERWIGDLFQGFNAIATHLLPDAVAKSIRSAKTDAKKVGRKATGIHLAQLSRLHAELELVPQGDAQGNPIPGCWALSLDGAEQAQMKTNDPRQRGVIFFRQTE